MNEEHPAELPSAQVPPAEAQPVAVQPADAQPAQQPQRNEPPRFDPRRRMRELMAIPERDRSDAVWDELIELEIQTAPGNRAVSPNGNPNQQQPQQQFRKQDQGKRQGQQQPRGKSGKRPFNQNRRGPGKLS
jgi:hypothetical protein